MSPTKYESFKDLLAQEKSALWVFVVYTVVLTVLWNVLDLGDWILNLQGMDWAWWVGPGFALLYVIRGFFYFPSLYFIIAASLLFPFPFSVLYYLAGVFASAILSYHIGLYLREQDHFPKLLSFVEKPDIQARIKNQGLKGIFFLHVTGISLDIPNYFSGYLRISFCKFFLTILAANLITTTIYFTLFHTGVVNIVTWLEG